jgi:hypothetical protein
VFSSQKSIPLSLAGLVRVIVIIADEGAMAHHALIDEVPVVLS